MVHGEASENGNKYGEKFTSIVGEVIGSCHARVTHAASLQMTGKIDCVIGGKENPSSQGLSMLSLSLSPDFACAKFTLNQLADRIRQYGNFVSTPTCNCPSSLPRSNFSIFHTRPG